MQRPKVYLVQICVHSGHHHLRRSDPCPPLDIHVQVESDYLRIKQERLQVEQRRGDYENQFGEKLVRLLVPRPQTRRKQRN